jgi:hypothetical protein
MNLKPFAVAALSIAIASPALAMGPHARSEAVQHRQQQARVYQHEPFWPGDVAAGVIGGAVGTAGAIATAPFRAFAYNGYYGRPYYGYENGFVCRPGTTFIGEDGLRHMCQ